MMPETGDDQKKMRVLVTGANGFVGSTLCPQLESKGHQVVRAVRRIPSQSSQQWVNVGDIDAQTDWMPTLEGVDVVVHLAARVHVMHDTAADPLAAFREVNVLGTKRLVEQCIQAGVKRLIYLSSIKVNGEQTAPGHPFTEQTPVNTQSPYGISKLEAEDVLRNQTGIETVVVRPPLVYGPGVGANFLRLMQLIDRGLPLPLGWTRNKRSLVAVQNLCDFLIQCGTHPAAVGETFLISDGHDLSTTELIRCIARHLGKQPILLPVPPEFVSLPGPACGQNRVCQAALGQLAGR